MGRFDVSKRGYDAEEKRRDEGDKKRNYHEH
jgi:hypothetical protein